ncbi:S-methyl-5'-thioadenosine phosphorylase [Streptomyces iconiensis]|uniref:S-methyl-5'-thioadenosine phosphorylase n=1 Tax=Streptomyces iconiensis TaxID=1384038 RepID=A0ABT6ZNA3_9ACTN|nr:S-methyl-5'-thioadenosine phosphorylase [Streptomyces iconiensis]MDJ1130529.1 S-methyl-5'-thioadenosine phosphorylase [Streptomyces iconiensis]
MRNAESTTLHSADIGIIGGSGLYEFEGLKDVQKVTLNTPYGAPSDPLVLGKLGDRSVAFLARHGAGHRIAPSDIPARANLYALKYLGVQEVISVGAVGSLRGDIAPGDIVILDQLIDHTRGTRPASFFGDGLVAHVSLADPYCGRVRSTLGRAAAREHPAVHEPGTYCCIEGPQFSTRAESELYRSWGMDVIGMTALPEARLAREAELCYAGLALVTDYDCWHPGHDAVDARSVAEVMASNVDAAQRIVRRYVEQSQPGPCPCHRALDNALLTDSQLVSGAAGEPVPSLLLERVTRVA